MYFNTLTINTKSSNNTAVGTNALSSLNSTSANWQSLTLSSQFQKCADIISANLANKSVIAYTTPSITPIIVLFSTGIYVINA